jgi:hypothetical protein
MAECSPIFGAKGTLQMQTPTSSSNSIKSMINLSNAGMDLPLKTRQVNPVNIPSAH